MSEHNDTPNPTPEPPAPSPEPPRPAPRPETIDQSQGRERLVNDALAKQGIITQHKDHELTYSIDSKPRSDADFIEKQQIAERQRALVRKAATASDMNDVLTVTNEGLSPAPQPSGAHRELLARKAGSYYDYSTAVPRKGSAYEGSSRQPDVKPGQDSAQPTPKPEPTPPRPAPRPTPPGRGSRGR